ncbi:hypothetical protein LIER_33286 [Lithospermum erythrorhizon]|uniref:Uncharacterized protein n=1 Tax=Lithospermum erythrorhizon TaxID=34254 RepID=A0AAV3RW97_LITER
MSRRRLLDWKSRKLGHVQLSIQSKKAELDALQQGVITVTLKGQATVLAKHIDKLREADDIYWCQRSKVFWRVKGDRNTAYFHASSAQRGKSNLITAL